MSLGRMSWGLRLLIMMITATIVIANQHRHQTLPHAYGHEDSLKLINNVTHKDGDHRISHARQHHHQHLGNPGTKGHGPWKLPHLRHHHVAHRGPYFEDAQGREIDRSEVAAQLGDTALLDCRVVMLSGKMVMWIRQSPDAALLTVGESTHIVDARYEVRFKYPNNWRLAISSIQKEDRGVYVCQVNTHPPKMLLTNFTVLAPDIRIVDEANHELRDRYYKTGSIIELTCATRASRPSSKVPHPVWKKNGETLPDHVNVHHVNGSNHELLTRLRIEHAKKSDSGEFGCSIGHFSTARAVVNIHVLNGEKQAAVHHDQWNVASAVRLSSHRRLFEMLLPLLLLLLMLNVDVYL